MIYRKFQRERDKMNTPKYLEIAELLRIDIFVKHAKEISTNSRYQKIRSDLQCQSKDWIILMWNLKI